MIKEIKYTGFTATPSDYECPDGELDAAVNLIPEDGELKPIQVADLWMEIPEGFYPIFIHKTSDCYNVLIYNGTSVKYINKDDENKTVHNITDAQITKIEALKNALIFFCENYTLYLRWDKTDYKIIGTDVPELPIVFGLETNLVTKEKRFGPLTFSYDDDEGMNLMRQTHGGNINDPNGWTGWNSYDDVLYGPMIDVADDILDHCSLRHGPLDNIPKELFNPMKNEAEEENKFMLPFFVRYAFRMYDGNLSMRSSPVLMIPCTIPVAIWKEGINPDTGYDYFTHFNKGYDVQEGYWQVEIHAHAVVGKLLYKVLQQSYINEIVENWSDLIKSVEVFVSQPLYLYKETSFEVDNIDYTKKGETTFARFDYFGTHYNVPFMTISKLSGKEHYDCYLQREINNENICLLQPSYTENEIREKITSVKNFYHISSIPIEELRTSLTEVPMESGCLSALVQKETSDEIGGGLHEHDTYHFRNGFAYNSRMIFYNNIRKLGVTRINANTLVPYTDKIANDLPGNLTVYTSVDNENWIADDITKTAIVSANTNYTLPFIFLPCNEIQKIRLDYTSPLLNNLSRTFVAYKHDFLSGIYIYLGFTPIAPRFSQQNGDFEYSNTPIEYDEDDKLHVSEFENPWVLESSNAASLPVKNILKVTTITKALSQGQFGQFPLYAFTTEGVWALEISNEGTIKSVHPVTRDVCTDKDSVTQIDNAVLFSTDRGIMLLSGSDSICITDSISSDSAFLTSSLTKLSNLTHACITTAADIVPFKQFLNGAKMLYDYTNQRIIVYNPDKDYAYVYSLKSKLWGMMKSNIKNGINSYPECLAVDGSNNIINMSSVTSNDEPVVNALLITRPLKLDAPDLLKTVDTIIQRGHFRKGSVNTILYGSRDLFNWHLVASSTDHYLRGFRGTPYKYFRIVLLCNLNKDESIFGCTVQYTPRLTDKLR